MPGAAIIIARTPRHYARLLQQLARCLCAHMFHHRQQHSSGGFGVGLGVVVVKRMADVRRESAELVIWQVWPDAFGYATRANIIKLRTRQGEMVKGGLQRPEVELRVVRNNER